MNHKMVLRGDRPLKGAIAAQGAKNAALPVMASALLMTDGALKISRVPDLHDIQTMSDLLRNLGAEVLYSDGKMNIRTPEKLDWATPSALVRKMRASSLVLGPLLARCHRAVLPLPGGCAIGSRPIDLHLKGLTKMGAEIKLEHGSVHAEAKKLKGTRIYLDFPSVGATENLLMAAVLAEGETVIENAAREPEISNLAAVLCRMGGHIEGDGTGTIRIRGVQELHEAEIEVIPDRIEASTYILAGVITGGEVEVRGMEPEHLEALLAKLEEAGVRLAIEGDCVRTVPGERLSAVSLKTLPYPGFPTDLQPQIMAALCMARGTSVIQERVFESRFLHVSELKRMGCQIELQGDTAIITGVEELTGAEVRATDLRAGAALVLAGLAANGYTSIYQMGHIQRGYENMVDKLRCLGGEVEIVPCDENEGPKF